MKFIYNFHANLSITLPCKQQISISHIATIQQDVFSFFLPHIAQQLPYSRMFCCLPFKRNLSLSLLDFKLSIQFLRSLYLYFPFFAYGKTPYISNPLMTTQSINETVMVKISLPDTLLLSIMNYIPYSNTDSTIHSCYHSHHT